TASVDDGDSSRSTSTRTGSAANPLELIVSALARRTPLTQLLASSSDIRATLRLFDLSYIDILASLEHTEKRKHQQQHGESHDEWEGAMHAADSNGIHILDSLSAHLCSPQGNALLADCLDGSDNAQISERIVQCLLQRIRDSKDVDRGLRELFTAARIPNGPWLRELLDALANGILDSTAANEGCTQLLCLLAQVLEEYGADALRLVASLETLRRLARHIIKLLSEPQPTVAASALHALTRLLLLAPSASSGRPSPLTILSDSLRGKLFDEAHFGRTMLLASDLCQNCTGEDPSELLVLDSIAGMVSCIALHTGQNAANSATPLQLTEMAPAIRHLVILARENRQYLHPLLKIVNCVLTTQDQNKPLVDLLFQSSQLVSVVTDDDVGSVVAEMFDMVISGLEDAPYTMPSFSGERGWPRVSSDECGGGWLVNANRKQRTQVVDFLANALRLSATTHDSEACMSDELMQAIASAVVDTNITANDQQKSPEVFVSTYFWAVRPVLEIAVELVRKSEVFASCWQSWFDGAQETRAWAVDVCATAATNPGELLGDAMSRDMVTVGDDRSVGSDDPYIEQKNRLADPRIAAAVATPAESVRSSLSSGTVSPHPQPSSRMLNASPVIGIDMMRAASSTTPASLTLQIPSNSTTVIPTANQVVARSNLHTVVLRQWARVCETEMAFKLVSASATAESDENIVKRVFVILASARRQLDAYGHSVHPLLVSMSAVDMQRQLHAKAVQELSASYAASIADERENREDAEQEISEMRKELDKTVSQLEHVTMSLQQASVYADSLKAEAMQLADLKSELLAQCQTHERDVQEWKQECIGTRAQLEAAEAQIEEMDRKLRADTEAYQKQVSEVTSAQGVLRETAAGLERALGDAVARLRVLEMQSLAERATSDELRGKNAAMAAHLTEYLKIAESMHSLSRLQHN
ncbi:hypothetical protein LPJ53_005864, partial [Coemansia erecta]